LSKLSIKKIRRLAEEEHPKAIANYLRKFLPPVKRNALEVKVDEYAHLLMKNVHNISKSDIEKKLEELSNEKIEPEKEGAKADRKT